MSNIVNTVGQNIEFFALIAAVAYGIIHFTFEYFGIKSRFARKNEYLLSFKETVKNLSSDNKATQLSAAILLRRYFEEKFVKKNPEYRKEAINVISSLLRTLPIGTLQKTLGDGLAYAGDLTRADLQRTNLQDLYIGRQEGRIIVTETDMYLADLSYALIENIEGNAKFYHSILYKASIKNSDLSGANFRNADLKNARFDKVKLYNADFEDAINVPDDIKRHLVGNKFADDAEFTSDKKEKQKTIFFSMPGHMSAAEKLLTEAYQRMLIEDGFNVFYYLPDEYPHAGQLNKVRQSIEESSAMIAFGFKQINIKQGTYHQGEDVRKDMSDKWLSTPWSEIEVGMGLMRGLPILLVKDMDIEDGVFDVNLSECFVDTIIADTRTCLVSRDGAYANWLSRFT